MKTLLVLVLFGLAVAFCVIGLAVLVVRFFVRISDACLHDGDRAPGPIEGETRPEDFL